jgi:urease accessory protein
MAWHAQLDLDYSVEAGRTVARHRHTGPLRILQSLYPEGDTTCHNVVVHPPGGLVGGDTLEMHVRLRQGAHGLVTTPGATRFYRSDGAQAMAHTHIALEADARMEWLPLEALCYSGCLAKNQITMEVAAGAELIGWDVAALGLPNANQPFVQGQLLQHLEVPGVWLERGTIDATDTRLMHSPVGMANHQCLASLFFIAGQPLARPRRDALLEAARTVLASHALASSAGATSPNPQVVLVRVLAPVVEPAMQLLRELRRVWRSQLWNTAGADPRIWSM